MQHFFVTSVGDELVGRLERPGLLAKSTFRVGKGLLLDTTTVLSNGSRARLYHRVHVSARSAYNHNLLVLGNLGLNLLDEPGIPLSCLHCECSHRQTLRVVKHAVPLNGDEHRNVDGAGCVDLVVLWRFSNIQKDCPFFLKLHNLFGVDAFDAILLECSVAYRPQGVGFTGLGLHHRVEIRVVQKLLILGPHPTLHRGIKRESLFLPVVLLIDIALLENLFACAAYPHDTTPSLGLLRCSTRSSREQTTLLRRTQLLRTACRGQSEFLRCGDSHVGLF
mmetsp:Transcript_30909/g.67522  ORF Transcript_30909/g.67522 Transcript_30909/m.67522 type:complete len:278 (+) Transcript_30909:954-1787(+)